jgi:hypothetical protein
MVLDFLCVVYNAAWRQCNSVPFVAVSRSGWKKDWDGKWIRDEEAEFDSDEEAPDLP